MVLACRRAERAKGAVCLKLGTRDVLSRARVFAKLSAGEARGTVRPSRAFDGSDSSNRALLPAFARRTVLNPTPSSLCCVTIGTDGALCLVHGASRAVMPDCTRVLGIIGNARARVNDNEVAVELQADA